MGAGTIQSMVALSAMQNQWQKKKNDINAGKTSELTSEQRELQMYQSQADDIREGQKPAAIDIKLASGSRLNAEEIEYLKKHNPQALKDYEEEQRERENYKRQLRNCRSKEEVERVKTAKMGEFLSSCKSIASSPYIPKDQKCAMLKKLLREVMGIQEEHQEFVESAQYAILPDEDEDTKSKKTDNSTDTISSEDNSRTKGEVTTDDEDPLETIRQAIAANGTVLEAPKQNAADSTDTESTAEAQPEKTKAGTVTVIADSGNSGHTGTVKMAGKTAAFAGVSVDISI